MGLYDLLGNPNGLDMFLGIKCRGTDCMQQWGWDGDKVDD